MLLQQDLDVLWEAYQKLKEASDMLSKVDQCKLNSKARYLRSNARDSIRESRRKITAIKRFIEKHDDETREMFR